MKKNGGFTLVELIIVIAILAILSSVAVAGYSSYITKANNSAVESWLNNISTAATLANAQTGSIVTITVKEGTGNDAGKLVVTIEGTAGLDAKNFVTDFQGAITGISGSIQDGKYVGTITPPSAWDASEYDDETASWSNAGWTK
jgi:prepilin-type N-terminal cleavage/methylation domain-containing protein